MNQHQTTWIAFFRYALFALIVCSTVYVMTDQRAPGVVTGHGMYDHHVYTFGWPIVAGTHLISEPMLANPPQGMDRLEYWDFNWWWVAVDVIVITLIFICSFFVAHKWRNFQFSRFSLASLLIATTIAAFAILVSPYEFDWMRRLIASISSEVGSYHPVTLYPLWLCIPVLCGIACVLLLMAKLIFAASRRLTWVLR